MNIEQAASAPTADDFADAFSTFASPDDKGTASAAAAPAEGEAAAAGGEGDGTGAGDGGSAAGGGDAAAAGVGDGGGDGDQGSGDGAAAPAAGEGGEAAAGAADESAAGAAAPAEGAAAPAAGPSADDILKTLSGLIKAAPAATAAPEGAAATETPSLYNEEETTFLTGYDKDWGDVVKGEALKRRAEYQELLGYVFKQVADFVKPLKETTEILAERTHVADTRAAIPDYSDNLRDEVEGWVKTQPEYLQAAYNQVITAGSVDEVKDLVERYRGATGKVAAGAVTPKPPKKGNELSEDAKKAAAALAPVESGRSGIVQPGDPSNFDDAWKQFSNET